MLKQLSHTPVAKNSRDIFAHVGGGNVLLLEADMGSGKSLVSPVVIQTKLQKPVLVLVPSVDVARKNAQLIAKLSGLGWKFGREVGVCAGGQWRDGLHIMVATYGAFVARSRLRNRDWGGIVLDESHVEQWQVEVARADVHDALNDNADLFVMEASATMNHFKLAAYWQQAGDVVSVVHHKIEGKGTPYQRELIEVPTYGSKSAVERKVCVAETIKRLEAGDRFVMVTQPGQREVEDCADLIEAAAQRHGDLDVEIYTYHGETDQEEVEEMLGELDPAISRVIVATPRLLTGMNMEDLDSIVTDGIQKYPESDTNGNTALIPGHMSQAELQQALGRIGRFKDGVMVLCSDMTYNSRPAVMVPEVERLSSLPLALGLVCLERNPLKVNFCNQPKDLRGSMERLHEWDFVDDLYQVNEIGKLANQLEIRPDVANFVLGVWTDEQSSVETTALAVITAAVIEGGSIAFRFPKDENGNEMLAPLLNGTSDIFNEVARFLQAVQWDKERTKNARWVSLRGLRRCRGGVYRLLRRLRDDELSEYFDSIFNEDKEAKQAAWKTIGRRMEYVFKQEREVIVRHLIRTMGSKKLYQAIPGYRGIDGHDISGLPTPIGNHSRALVGTGQLFMANTITIQTQRGGLLDLLVDVTTVTISELTDALPDVFQTSISATPNRAIGGGTTTERQLLVNGDVFHIDRRFQSSDVEAEIAELFG